MLFKRLRSKKELSNEILALENKVKELEIIIENNEHVIKAYKPYYYANKTKNTNLDIELYHKIK